MYIEFPCWKCGKTLKARQLNSGKKCKCNKCESINSIPGELVVEASDDDAVAFVGDIRNEQENEVQVSHPSHAFEEFSSIEGDPDVLILVEKRKQSKIYTVDEPWYFKSITIWAYVNICIGLLFELILLGLFFYAVVRAAFEGAKLRELLFGSGLYFLGTFLAILAFMASWGFVLLIVDVARNIRGIRHALFMKNEKNS